MHEEIPHYLVRNTACGASMAFAAGVFHFFLPFGMLLMRPIKDRPKTIAIVAVIVIVMRYVVHLLARRAVVVRRALHLVVDGSHLAPRHRRRLDLGLHRPAAAARRIIPIHETWVEEAIREGALKVHA